MLGTYKYMVEELLKTKRQDHSMWSDSIPIQLFKDI